MTAPLADAERWGAWDRFVEAQPEAGFMQSSAWARVRAGVGYEHFAVTLKDGDSVVGGALVGKWTYAPGRCFYYIQDGPLLPADPGFAAEVWEAVMQSVERHRRADTARVSHLRIEPRWPALPAFVQGFAPPLAADGYTEPRHTLCIDLRASDDELLAQMKPKGRYNVRVARQHGVAVVEDHSARGVADFLRIQRRTADRHAIDAKPPSYFRTMLAEFEAPRRVRLFFAEYRGRRLATALVVTFGRRATYFYGGSLVLHRHVMAPYLLHFEIMRAMQQAGCDAYDLWGVAPPDQPDHAWRDISTFKRKFGGAEVALVPTLDRVFDAAAYRRDHGAARAETRVAPLPGLPVAARAPRAARRLRNAFGRSTRRSVNP